MLAEWYLHRIPAKLENLLERIHNAEGSVTWRDPNWKVVYDTGCQHSEDCNRFKNKLQNSDHSPQPKLADYVLSPVERVFQMHLFEVLPAVPYARKIEGAKLIFLARSCITGD